MEEKELIKNVELELQWLKYYALAESPFPDKNGRHNFDPTKSPYDQLVSIGYTKRVTSLDKRCAFLRLTAKTPIKDTPLEEMISHDGLRDPENNVYSALEVFMLKYPEKHAWVIEALQ